MNDLLIIDMLPTYGLLFYLLISVFVFVGCRGLRRRTSDRGLLRFAVGAFLVVSALGAVFAALVYIMAAPLAQPDMVDFYRMYRPGALIFLLGLFIIQFVFGVAAGRHLLPICKHTLDKACGRWSSTVVVWSAVSTGGV